MMMMTMMMKMMITIVVTVKVIMIIIIIVMMMLMLMTMMMMMIKIVIYVGQFDSRGILSAAHSHVDYTNAFCAYMHGHTCTFIFIHIYRCIDIHHCVLHVVLLSVPLVTKVKTCFCGQ